MAQRAAVLLLLALPLILAAPDPTGAQDKPAPGEAVAGQPVLVLGRTQLLEDVKAFGEFVKKNEKRKRSEVRREVVEKLKEIAETEQEEILEALGNPPDARRLWIVNAVVTTLDAGQIERVKKLECVKYLYPAGSLGGAVNVVKVAEVLENEERKPFETKGKKIPWHLIHLRVPRVWKQLKITGEGALVVSFDMGMNYRHEDLRGNVWRNPDEVPNDGKDDDGNGLIDDYYGYDFARGRAEVIAAGRRQHGTWTSCLVIGDGTSGTITGVAPRARLMPVIAMGGPYLAARAMQYALEKDADVVSMSFSIPNLGNSRGLWRRIAEHATCAGLVLVSGAGNFQQQAKIPVQIRIPEGIPCVVCAGGVNDRMKVPSFCSLGPVEWSKVKFYEDFRMPKGLVKPDVAAFPGPNLSLVSVEDEGYLPDNNSRHGNSLSAPQVAGVCALLMSANPELNSWRVKEILERTARDIPPRGKDPRTGRGLVDAYAAVKAALGE